MLPFVSSETKKQMYSGFDSFNEWITGDRVPPRDAIIALTFSGMVLFSCI
jgi:hypothetical protein